MLAGEPFKERHMFDRVAEHLDKIQKQFAVSESKIVAAVTDNSSNFIKAFKEFGIELHTEEGHPLPARHSSGSLLVETDERGEDSEGYINVMIEDCNDESIILPPHYRCCSHTLNLVCTSDAKKKKQKRGKLYQATQQCIL